jgi:hypothetical protein
VWGWPDWAYASSDGTFNNRYDDPGSLYRVLYASRSTYGWPKAGIVESGNAGECVIDLRRN